MKKTLVYGIFSVLIGSIVVFGAMKMLPTAHADASNLIQNPTLSPDPSNAAIPLGWLFGSNGTNDATSTYPAPGPNASTTAAEVTITSYTSGFSDWFTTSSIPVTPFAEYQFTDEYLSSGPSVIEADYTINGTSTPYYTDIATLAATNGTWATASTTFNAPANATSLTIYHVLDGVGSLSMANPSLVELAGPQVFPQGMVSLTFDDGWQTQYDTAFPMLQAAGFPATFYIVTQSMTAADTIGTSTGQIDNNYMNTNEVLTLNAAGNEIGDHTVNHCDLVTGLCPDADVPNSPDPLNAMQEIEEASSTLHADGLVPVDTFAYPYGSYNTTAENDLQQDGFISGRSVDRGYNLMDSNRYTLEIQYVNASTTTDADFQNVVKPWIDYAVANKVWLVLLFHQIEPSSTIAQTADPDATTPEMLQDVVTYLKQNSVKVVTVHDAVCMMDGMSSSPDCATPVVYPKFPSSTSTAPVVTFVTTSTLSSATAGSAYSAEILATSTNASDTLTWNVAGLPAWATATTSTATIVGDELTIAGTPQAGDVGSSTIIVKVTGANASSTSVTQSFSLTVTASSNGNPDGGNGGGSNYGNGTCPTSTAFPISNVPSTVKMMTVNVCGLTANDLANVTLRDGSNGTLMNRAMEDWQAPFFVPNGNPYVISASTPSFAYTVSFSAGCSGKMTSNAVCDVEFTK